MPKTDNPKINRKTWYKLLGEICGVKKIPILALRNKSRDVFIVLGVDDFFDLINKKQENT